jgi:hypothetical protein
MEAVVDDIGPTRGNCMWTARVRRRSRQHSELFPVEDESTARAEKQNIFMHSMGLCCHMFVGLVVAQSTNSLSQTSQPCP